MSYTLRPYQTECLTSIAEAADRGVRRQLVALATGGGKTVIFAHLPQALGLRGRMLVLAHREELLDQAAAKLAAINPGLRVEVEQAGRRADGADIVVGSVATLGHKSGKRLAQLPPTEFEIIVIDEAHHAVAASYRRVLEHFGCLDPWNVDAPLLVGVTATPERGDEVGLAAVFEAVVYEKHLRQMIAEGWLVRIRAWRAETGTDLSGVHTRQGDYVLPELAEAVNTPERNYLAVRSYEAHALGRRAVAFCVDVRHAHDVAAMFEASYIPAAAIDGSMTSDQRREILRQFSDGEILVLANCLDTQTEILTRRGWVDHASFRADDETAAFDPSSGAVCWEKISRIVKRPRGADERMVVIKNQTLDVRVTAGHRLLVRDRNSWRFLLAEDLPNVATSYMLPLAGCAEFEGVALTTAELEFIGLFISDGTMNKKRASVEITQKASAIACVEIERILTACDFDWKMTESELNTTKGLGRYRRYRIPKGNIGGYLRRRGWSRLEAWLTKSIHPSLDQCTREQFENLLHGLWLGDGYKRSGPRASSLTICNTDTQLLDRLQAMASVRGFASALRWRVNGREEYKRIGTLRIRRRATVKTNNHWIQTSGGNPAVFEAAYHDETVWCVTNSTGTIITRRNGCVMIMGQCMLLTEGFDEPKIGALLMMRPTKSRALYTQMVGRGTRLCEGKSDVIVIDLADVTNHSLPTAATLLGLPPKFDCQGRDVLEEAKQLELIAAETEAPHVLERALSIDDARRLLREVDIIGEAVRQVRAELKSETKFAWLRLPSGIYFLSLPGDRVITLREDQLGMWHGQIKDPNGYTGDLLTAPHADAIKAGPLNSRPAAMAFADAYVRSFLDDAVPAVRTDASWTKQPATEKQIELLKRMHKWREGAQLTRGEARDLINTVIRKRKAVS